MKMKGIAGWTALVFAGMVLGALCVRGGGAQSSGTPSTASPGASGQGHLKLGLVLTQDDPETVFNAFRVAQYSLEQGDEVSVFLLGKGVDLERIQDPRYNVQEKARAFASAGGRILACGTCLQMHNSAGSTLCPVSTMDDLYKIVASSDRVLTF